MFNGRTVLISGGNKGIGKGIALEFAKKGANVAIGCNHNPEMAADTLAELNKYSKAIAIHADISLPESCEKLVKETVKNFGSLDILINNAALQTHYSILESNLDVYKRVININLRAPFLLLKYSHEHLKKTGDGRVIMISSVHGKRPLDVDAAYCISKGGMEMLMREAAVELAADGITVNSIAPGAVKTEGKTGSPRRFDSTVKKHMPDLRHLMTGRVGLPEDTAYIACFLASKEASQITGSTFRTDGGAMLV